MLYLQLAGIVHDHEIVWRLLLHLQVLTEKLRLRVWFTGLLDSFFKLLVQLLYRGFKRLYFVIAQLVVAIVFGLILFQFLCDTLVVFRTLLPVLGNAFELLAAIFELLETILLIIEFRFLLADPLPQVLNLVRTLFFLLVFGVWVEVVDYFIKLTCLLKHKRGNFYTLFEFLLKLLHFQMQLNNLLSWVIFGNRCPAIQKRLFAGDLEALYQRFVEL